MDSQDLQRLIENAIPESSFLEYKQELPLEAPKERREALKDLTGIGNGGGGTLLFGMAERADGIADHIQPMTDRAIASVVEDIVRNAVRPPLLWESNVIEVEGGFVLEANVHRSPLGPYMVETYGERRYHVRIGRSTVPMDEQQVRDAYFLAARSREHRGDLWAGHLLPMSPFTDEPWLLVSVLPEEPLVDLFDPATLPPDELKPSGYISDALGMSDVKIAMARPSVWANGIFGDSGYGERTPRGVVRIHRDGAVGLGQYLGGSLDPFDIPRSVHGLLLYAGWLVERLGVRNLVELDITFAGLSSAQLTENTYADRAEVSRPPGVPVSEAGMRRTVLPGDLMRARARHDLVKEATNRLVQTFGARFAELSLTIGRLYRPDGRSLGLSYRGRCLWNENDRQVAIVYDDGRITHLNYQFVVGWLRDGVVLDPEGRTMAMLEFASGAGVPDDFLLARLDDPRFSAPDSGKPDPAPTREAPPQATGEISDVDLIARLRPEVSS